MDNNIHHEIRNALASMAGINKERIKLIHEFEKKMAQLSKDYLVEMRRIERALH